MRGLTITSRVLIVLLIAVFAAGQSFKVYPGATKFNPPETKESQEARAMAPGTETSAYLTSDSFEKVVAFYRGFATEYTMPRRRKAAPLPSGQEVQQTFFIFDDARDIVTSKNWAKVQRPFIGSFEMKGMTPEYHDIRDVTEIVVSRKK